ncbi:glycine zipper 2TM domain-containing protein [Massilia sp. W12]|uniref:glycine zipper 2TM domain-containing protein n=1 Tax=Massilia sp. W12 TaxID=3126507 RepID=UPI0030D1D73D
MNKLLISLLVLLPLCAQADVNTKGFTYVPRGAEVVTILAHHEPWHNPPGHEKKKHKHDDHQHEHEHEHEHHTVKSGTQSKTSSQARGVCSNCGVVQAVNTVQLPAETTGVGAVAGAVVGGVLGNQVGGGDGKKLATVAGAAAGGVIGNEIEKKSASGKTVYDVVVKMEDGSVQTLRMNDKPAWKRGEKVVLDNGGLLKRK